MLANYGFQQISTYSLVFYLAVPLPHRITLLHMIHPYAQVFPYPDSHVQPAIQSSINSCGKGAWFYPIQYIIYIYIYMVMSPCTNSSSGILFSREVGVLHPVAIGVRTAFVGLHLSFGIPQTLSHSTAIKIFQLLEGLHDIATLATCRTGLGIVHH